MLLPRCCGWCSAPAPIGGRIPGMGPGWIKKLEKKKYYYYFNLINNRKITTEFSSYIYFCPIFSHFYGYIELIIWKIEAFKFNYSFLSHRKGYCKSIWTYIMEHTCAQIRKIWIRPVFIICRWRASTTNGCAGRCRRIGFGTSSIWTIFLFFLLLPFSRISRLHPTLPLLFLVCIFSLGCLFAFNLRAVS